MCSYLFENVKQREMKAHKKRGENALRFDCSDASSSKREGGLIYMQRVPSNA
jgi:hypothetical protein